MGLSQSGTPLRELQFRACPENSERYGPCVLYDPRLKIQRQESMRHAHVQFKTPWVRVTAEEKARLEAEFAEERSLLHNLAATDCWAVARRIDSNDVLFELTPHLCECAVVRLTGSGHVEMQHGIPSFDLFATFDDWVQERMLPDHESYSTGDQG